MSPMRAGFNTVVPVPSGRMCPADGISSSAVAAKMPARTTTAIRRQRTVRLTITNIPQPSVKTSSGSMTSSGGQRLGYCRA